VWVGGVVGKEEKGVKGWGCSGPACVCGRHLIQQSTEHVLPGPVVPAAHLSPPHTHPSFYTHTHRCPRSSTLSCWSLRSCQSWHATPSWLHTNTHAPSLPYLVCLHTPFLAHRRSPSLYFACQHMHGCPRFSHTAFPLHACFVCLCALLHTDKCPRSSTRSCW
jgi:hypothetical protein